MKMVLVDEWWLIRMFFTLSLSLSTMDIDIATSNRNTAATTTTPAAGAKNPHIFSRKIEGKKRRREKYNKKSSRGKNKVCRPSAVGPTANIWKKNWKNMMILVDSWLYRAANSFPSIYEFIYLFSLRHFSSTSLYTSWWAVVIAIIHRFTPVDIIWYCYLSSSRSGRPGKGDSHDRGGK